MRILDTIKQSLITSAARGRSRLSSLRDDISTRGRRLDDKALSGGLRLAIIAASLIIIVAAVAAAALGALPVFVNGGPPALNATNLNNIVNSTNRAGVSVIDFGADPTGAADSTSAFDAAMVAGNGNIYIPAGTYKVNLNISTYQHFNIEGSNYNTTLKPNDPSLPVVKVDGNSTYIDTWSISRLRIDGRGSPNATYGLMLAAKSPCVVSKGHASDIRVESCTYGVYMVGDGHAEIYKNSFEGIITMWCQYGVYIASDCVYSSFLSCEMVGVLNEGYAIMDGGYANLWNSISADGPMSFMGVDTMGDQITVEDIYGTYAASPDISAVRIAGTGSSFGSIVLTNIPNAKANTGVSIFNGPITIQSVRSYGTSFPNYLIMPDLNSYPTTITTVNKAGGYNASQYLNGSQLRCVNVLGGNWKDSMVNSTNRAGVSVIDCGADPTGTGDSTPAFNAALALGKGNIYIPNGTYKVNLNLTDTFYIEGAGRKTTELRANNSSLPVIKLYGNASNIAGWGIKGLTIEGLQTASYGLYFTAKAPYVITKGTAEDLLILNCEYGIYMIGGGAAEVYKNEFTSVSTVYCKYGIWIASDGVYNSFTTTEVTGVPNEGKAIYDGGGGNHWSSLAVDGPMTFAGQDTSGDQITVEKINGTYAASPDMAAMTSSGAGSTWGNIVFTNVNNTKANTALSIFNGPQTIQSVRSIGSEYPNYLITVDASAAPTTIGNAYKIGGYTGDAYLSNAQMRAINVLGGNWLATHLATVRFDDAAPTAGTWVQGDIVYNTSAAAGGYVGWVCTSGGTPGTWTTFGAITA